MLRACTLNVGGIKSPSRFAAILSWASESEFQVFLLQECHLTTSPFDWVRGGHGADLTWSGSSHYLPGTGSTQGCLILLKHSLLLTDVSPVTVTAPGRVLRVDLTVGGHPASLVCVYAPVQEAERSEFYGITLPACLPDPRTRAVLMGGDFNCITHAADYVGPSASRGVQRAAESGAQALRSLMAGADPTSPWLVDVWRAHHPDRVDATHISASHNTAARLDRWLVSSDMAAWVMATDIEALQDLATDHFPVSLTLRMPPQVLLGRGLPRVEPLVYDDPRARSSIQALLRAATASLAVGAPPGADVVWWHRTLWSRTKASVLVAALAFQARLRREQLAQRRAWATAARVARQHFMMQAAAGDPAAAAAAILLQTTARLPVVRLLDRAERRLAAEAHLTHSYGERPTFYQHNKARVPHMPTLVRTLRVPVPGPVPGPAVVSLDSHAGLRAAQAQFVGHYSAASGGVFAAKQCDMQARGRLLASLTTRLSPAQARAAEGPLGDGHITEAELRRALSASGCGTAPGCDGLSVEFYLQFWDDLSPLLVAALAEAFDDVASNSPLEDFLSGVIALVPKPGKPADTVGGYRPITLLPVDTRIVARALSDRLQAPLDVLIDPSQTAFITGRDISDNVQYVMAMADYVRDHHQPLWLLFMDLAGAYDGVDWGLLRDTMVAMGFQAHGHVRWAQILHQGATNCIMLNRHLSAPFPVASGLLQGSAASPLYWCIVLQPLASYLASLLLAGRLCTPVIPQCSGAAMAPVRLLHAPVLPTYADDTSTGLMDPDHVAPGAPAPAHLPVGVTGSVQVLLVEGFHTFALAGGPSVSAGPGGKSVVVRAGAPPATVAQHAEEAATAGVLATSLRVLPRGTTVRHLGVPVAPGVDPNVVAHAAFAHGVGGLVKEAITWRSQALSLVGRVHIARQCMASQLVYPLGYLRPDPPQLQQLSLAITRFVAAASHPADAAPYSDRLYPCTAAFALPREEGGLGFPVLQHVSVAMQAKLIAQLPGVAVRPWQALVRHLLADPVSGLASWVVTQPNSVALPPALSRLAGHVECFAQLRVHRVVHPAQQSYHSVMAEPLFHNPDIVFTSLADGSAYSPAELLTSVFVGAVSGWRRLQDVYDTLHTSPAPLSLAAHAAVALVMRALPQPWQAHLLTHPSPVAEWECAVVPGHPGFVARQVQLAGGPVPEVLWAMSSGRLLPLLPGMLLPVGNVVVPLAALVWSPAAVAVLRKPAPRMSVAELVEQRQAPPHRPPWPREWWLLGPWASVWLDPAVWGWRAGGHTVDLTTFTVKAARLRLARLAWEAQDAKPNPSRGAPYSHGTGMWPRGWGSRPAIPVAGQQPLYDLTGITQLEDGWRSKYDEHLRVHHALGVGGLLPGERDAGPMPAVNSLAPLPHRPSPEQRRASQALRAAQLPGRHGRRLAAAAPVVLAVADVGAVVVGAPAAPVQPAAPGPGLASTGVWGRLLDPALQVAHRVVAWQVLHGQLMVGAFKFYIAPHLGTPAGACCAACRAAGRPDQLETLTHAFMDCPAVAPALDWLLNVYLVLTGETALRDPLVLLADADWHWRPTHPAMWRRLRTAFLGCAWALRCDHGADLQARSVAVAVAEALSRGVRRDWRRTLGTVRAEAAGIVPTVWFRGRPPDLSLPAFHKLWPSPGAWFVATPGVRDLHVRLSQDWPVAMPQVPPHPGAAIGAMIPAQGAADQGAAFVGPPPAAAPQPAPPLA